MGTCTFTFEIYVVTKEPTPSEEVSTGPFGGRGSLSYASFGWSHVSLLFEYSTLNVYPETQITPRKYVSYINMKDESTFVYSEQKCQIIPNMVLSHDGWFSVLLKPPEVNLYAM